MTKRKMLVIALYIGFFVCGKFVLKEQNILLIGLIYFCIGCVLLILYNYYKKIYEVLINYIFVLYEFMLLLFVSNRDWRHEILNYKYDDMCIFIFLLFSSPTILYVAYNFFQKQKLNVLVLHLYICFLQNNTLKIFQIFYHLPTHLNCQKIKRLLHM